MRSIKNEVSARGEIERFLSERCRLFDTLARTTWKKGSTLTELYRAFDEWQGNPAVGMGLHTFAKLLPKVAGVRVGRFGPMHTRGFNVLVRSRTLSNGRPRPQRRKR